MNSWEEYKYTTSADYYVDVPVYHCASTLQRRCVLCLKFTDEHIVGQYRMDDYRVSYQCPNKILRKWHNKYTHMCVGLPYILDTNEMEADKKTQ